MFHTLTSAAAFLTQTVSLDDTTSIKFEIWDTVCPLCGVCWATLIPCQAGQERWLDTLLGMPPLNGHRIQIPRTYLLPELQRGGHRVRYNTSESPLTKRSSLMPPRTAPRSRSHLNTTVSS